MRNEKPDSQGKFGLKALVSELSTFLAPAAIFVLIEVWGIIDKLNSVPR